MPLFFGSNALYPVAVMPGKLKAVSLVNPLSYQVDALCGLLLGTPAYLALDYGVLAVAAALGVLSASSLPGRLRPGEAVIGAPRVDRLVGPGGQA